jgi:hypothetical protein
MYNRLIFSFNIIDNLFKTVLSTVVSTIPAINMSRFLLTIRIVFGNSFYVVLAIATAVLFWVIFNILDDLLFFSPILVFYLPNDAITSFVLSNVTSMLLGLVVAMNAYIFRHTRTRINKASLFSGSTLSVVTSACASCSSLGFFLISTFGSVGLLASTILSNYQIPLRLISIGLLFWATYSASKRLAASCVLDNNTTRAEAENNNRSRSHDDSR